MAAKLALARLSRVKLADALVRSYRSQLFRGDMVEVQDVWKEFFLSRGLDQDELDERFWRLSGKFRKPNIAGLQNL